MKILTLFVFFSVMLPLNFVVAAENAEIAYLLSFVADSDCIFVRNGTEHKSRKARDHLEMKYNHAKGRITSAELFIEKIASKSSMSRRKYYVICDGEKIMTRQWLSDALLGYRASGE